MPAQTGLQGLWAFVANHMQTNNRESMIRSKPKLLERNILPSPSTTHPQYNIPLFVQPRSTTLSADPHSPVSKVLKPVAMQQQEWLAGKVLSTGHNAQAEGREGTGC